MDGERSETLEKNVTVTGGCSRRGGSGQGRRTREMAFSKWGAGRNAGERQGYSGRGHGGQDGYAKGMGPPGWEEAGKDSFWMQRTYGACPLRGNGPKLPVHPPTKRMCIHAEDLNRRALMPKRARKGIWHSMRSCLKGDDGAFRPGQGLLGNSLLCGLHIPREFLTQRRRFANFPRNWRLSKLRFPFSNSL